MKTIPMSVLVIGVLLIAFQNCGPAHLSGSSNSSSTLLPSQAETNPTPTPTPEGTPTNSLRIVTPVEVTHIASTSAWVSWGLSDYATGQHEYGTTTPLKSFHKTVTTVVTFVTVELFPQFLCQKNRSAKSRT